MRPSGRQPDELRPIAIECNVNRYAEGSCRISAGNTVVLCTASVEERIPPFLKGQGQGWVTAEYGMLPRATHTRGSREAARGKQSGRTQEIQRLIGRSLRSVVALQALGERTITIDCDVIQADGGTRCASITGAYVALHQALHGLVEQGKLEGIPLIGQVAAVSCGIYDAEPVLDLDYDEDSHCQADVNFVMTDKGGIIEVQGTAEESPFSDEAFHAMWELARKGVSELCAKQKSVLEAVETELKQAS